MKIETKNLILRKFTMNDVKDTFEYLNQRVDAEFERWNIRSISYAEKECEYRIKSENYIAIELKSEKKVIGNLCVSKKDFESCEIGFIINTDYQRRGFCAEACRALFEKLFADGTHRIFAECNSRNTASWKLLEKLGMRREAHFVKNRYIDTDVSGNPLWQDTYVYALLITDF